MNFENFGLKFGYRINMKVSNKQIDLQLVKRAKSGDYQAFDLLVLKYQSRLILQLSNLLMICR